MLRPFSDLLRLWLCAWPMNGGGTPAAACNLAATVTTCVGYLVPLVVPAGAGANGLASANGLTQPAGDGGIAPIGMGGAGSRHDSRGVKGTLPVRSNNILKKSLHTEKNNLVRGDKKQKKGGWGITNEANSENNNNKRSVSVCRGYKQGPTNHIAFRRCLGYLCIYA